MDAKRRPGFETLCIHFAEDREAHLGAASPPLHQSSTFTYPDCAHFFDRTSAEPTRYDYTRTGNPTTALLERKAAVLEQAEAARAFSSGMAAISAAVLSCVAAGDHLVAIETVYGPTQRLFSESLTRLGIETTYVRGTDIDDFSKALRPNTRLIYLESPSSLLFELQDLEAVAKLARAKSLATICDNSNATPYFQNPIPLGIDLVVHTATKYLGGHSDLVAGLVAGSKQRIGPLSKQQGELLGGVADPFASWLLLRGLRTLALRMERHQQSASTIARFLDGDTRVARVFYPGLDSHPQAPLARRQMRGQAGMLSLELRENDRDRACRVVDALRVFCIAVSWGGYESLAIPLEVADPATGRKTWIVRLSVGLESIEDLMADLDQALG